MKVRSLLVSLAAAAVSASLAGHSIGADNQPKPAATKPAAKPASQPKSTTIPPQGTPLAPADQAAIEKGIKELGAAIDELKAQLHGKPDASFLPDVQIYHNALRYPLQYNEPIDVKKAQAAIAEGMARATELKSGKHSWTEKSGPRGYVSKIDGSVQPFILSIPANYKPGQKEPLPLALSCHGRNERLMELEFISAKIDGLYNSSTVGDPKNKFVAYLYGRYCCANKLAGEIDLFETWKRIGEQFPIDKARVAVTGFSMGGGAAWHFAAHYGSDWVCATPGAGFSESERFLHLKEQGEVPPWYESALYHLYNATDHAANAANYPVISYAGDMDGQRQAGDVMEEAMAKEGLKLERFVGPGVGHKYEPATKKKMDERVEQIVVAGKKSMPQRVRFNTYSLRYDTMLWVTVTGLEKHWTKAVVDAQIDGGKTIRVTTQNVTSLFLKLPLENPPFPRNTKVTVVIDNQPVAFTEEAATTGMFPLHKINGKWGTEHAEKPANGLVKRHGLQGPIDDAFLDSFVVVRPGATGLTPASAAWTSAECNHAIDHWRKQFRGEARVKSPEAVSDDDITNSNLVLFGDPQSNPLIAKILPKLPIEWTKEKLVVNGVTFPADRFVPVMVYPNPLNPKRYVVLNSGFTFRERDYTNNARQTPKLPDYAVIDTQTPPGPNGWGKLPKAGFFGEHWDWQKDDGTIGQ
jgi:hypothetical protein